MREVKGHAARRVPHEILGRLHIFAARFKNHRKGVPEVTHSRRVVKAQSILPRIGRKDSHLQIRVQLAPHFPPEPRCEGMA